MRGFAGAFSAIAGWLYVMLGTNLLLGLTCLPFWVLAVFVDLRSSWLWLVVTSVLLSPALTGAYAVFRGHFLDDSQAVLGPYFAAWGRSWRRLWPVTLGFVGYFTLVIGDWFVVRRYGFGAPALPLAIVLAALGLATALVAWVGFPARPDLTRLAIVKAALYLSVRHAGWSLVSLLALGVLASVIWLAPALGVGLLATPVLYVVWANSRRIFAVMLPASEFKDDERGSA